MKSADEQAMETLESAVDRISALPTEILHNILSRVRMRTVVRMRRLSRRWRQVCESLQFICLNHREFESWTVEKFTRFLNNLLLLRAKVDLHTFQLHWYGNSPLNCNDVMMWIGYAVKHNVKVLDVDVGGYDRIFLPQRVFTCTFLQELNLPLGEARYGHVLPDIIRLPSLKKLTLNDVEVSQQSLDQIIAQSTGLEDLNLTDCTICFKLIDSKVLKRLTLYGFRDGLDRFTVATPHLIHFKCIGCPLEYISWRERPSLESLHIETCGHTFDGQSDFTGIILHAKTLTLLTFGDSDVKVMLEKELPTCSVFENLETLQIGDCCLTDNFYIVLRFLQLSPRLKKLILSYDKLPKAAKGVDAMPIAEMTFQCPLLKTVIIHCYKDDVIIDMMVNAMVANGVSLEKIHVTHYVDIAKRCISQVRRERQEEEKELSIFEKTLKENPEWVDGSSSAGSDSDSDNSDDHDDDESEDEDDDDESEDLDDYDKMEDEDDDDEMEEEDDIEDDMEEDGVDSSEHDEDDL